MNPAPIDERVYTAVGESAYPVLFVTVSGAHLYGFPSPDSDYDLRRSHILPPAIVNSLHLWNETVEVSETHRGLQVDRVTHDVRKFFGMVYRKNGYVLEHLYSPLIVRSSPEHEELKTIARSCITRHHGHHYLGFAANQWRLFEKESPRRVKPLLYVYRVLLTGIRLMRTGEIEANLVRLNEEFKLSYIPELIARKVEGPETAALDGEDVEFYHGEYERLRGLLEEAHAESSLPEQPGGARALDDLLVRLRVSTLADYQKVYYQMALAGDPRMLHATTCPVCLLFNAFREPGGYEICRRCGWEDDTVQRVDPDHRCGPNYRSLREAQRAWRSGRSIA